MNTYLLPVCDQDSLYIESVNANDLEEAKAKFIDTICDSYSYIEPALEWNDFIDDLEDHEIYLGEIYDKDEF